MTVCTDLDIYLPTIVGAGGAIVQRGQFAGNGDATVNGAELDAVVGPGLWSHRDALTNYAAQVANLGRPVEYLRVRYRQQHFATGGTLAPWHWGTTSGFGVGVYLGAAANEVRYYASGSASFASFIDAGFLDDGWIEFVAVRDAISKTTQVTYRRGTTPGGGDLFEQTQGLAADNWGVLGVDRLFLGGLGYATANRLAGFIADVEVETDGGAGGVRQVWRMEDDPEADTDVTITRPATGPATVNVPRGTALVVNGDETDPAGRIAAPVATDSGGARFVGTVGGLSLASLPAFDLDADGSIIVHAAAEDWTPPAYGVLVGKAVSATADSYMLRLEIGGNLVFGWNPSGGGVWQWATCTVQPSTLVADGAPVWLAASVDVDNGTGGADIKFWWAASNGDTVPTSWNQLGTTVTTGAVINMVTGSQPLEVGAREAGTLDRWVGRIFHAQVFAGITSHAAPGEGTLGLDLTSTDLARANALGRGAAGSTFPSTVGGTVTVGGGVELLGDAPYTLAASDSVIAGWVGIVGNRTGAIAHMFRVDGSASFITIYREGANDNTYGYLQDDDGTNLYTGLVTLPDIYAPVAIWAVLDRDANEFRLYQVDADGTLRASTATAAAAAGEFTHETGVTSIASVPGAARAILWDKRPDGLPSAANLEAELVELSTALLAAATTPEGRRRLRVSTIQRTLVVGT